MINILKRSIREYKKAAILTPLFVMLESILECLLPFITSKLIDSLENSSLEVIFTYCGVLLIVAMLSLLFGFLSAKYAADAATGFAKNLRHDAFYSIQDYSFSNIDKFSSSSLVTRLTTDIANIQMSFGMIIRIAVRVPLLLIFSVIMSFVVGGRVAWMFLIIMPILAIALFLIAKFAMPMFRKVFKKYDAFNESIQENINGIRVVKTYVREEYEKEKFNERSDAIKNEFTKAERIVAFNGPIMQLALFSALTIIAILGSYVVINTFGGFDQNGNPIYGELSTGRLQSLIAYGFQMLNSCMMASMIFVMLSMSVPAMKRVSEVIVEKPDIKNPENPIMEVLDGSIEFKNVSFKYSEHAEKNALDDVTLKIESGMTVGIIGGTGSSKTTLVNLISRLYDVTNGELLVGGVNVKDYDLKVLRDNVSVVLQKNVLFSGTIKENLLWGDINATDEQIKEACRLACADEFIESFPDGYNTYIEQGGTNVSGGQKQRLCIARALLKKPKVLILDDSTSAVDMKTDAIIRNSFKEFIPETTKIIIAQRLSSIENADLIVVLDNGKINDMGTSNELLSRNPIYQEVYEIQNKKGGEE